MKRFAESLVRQKGIKPPPGYKTSISICRKFLSEHAPKKADDETAGKPAPKPISPAQLLYAKKIAQRKGLVIPEHSASVVGYDDRRKAIMHHRPFSHA
jgi:DNA topoisomerase-3